MNIGFYTGAAGLVAFQSEMNVVGNNIANSSTTGFKPTTTSFEDLLHYKMYVNSTDEPLQGTGTRNVSTGMNMDQQSLQPTEGDLDYAIVGDGFFAVDNNGTPAFTRCGSFQASQDGTGKYYLADEQGRFVLNSQGARIPIARDAVAGRFKDVSSQIGIFQFKNPEALTQLTGNLYAENTASGQPAAVAGVQLKNGYLEQSGTSLVDEMTNMIQAQRGFQLSARVLQTNNEVEDTINDLRS